ncbi:MAG: pilus assembly protein [Alphaproteobacteria bacterium]|nr:pilus assembly protein [Alphaproteobacteria bacterium]
MIAFAFLALTGAVGLAVDAGRAEMVQAKLSSALDAAGLAAGSTISTANVQSEVTKYLNANFPSDYLGATITNVTVSVNSDATTITLSATATMPTTFMQIFDNNSVTVSAESEITRSSRGLELVMALDNTTSMQGSDLTSLKTAANLLVTTLFGSNSTVDNLWVGLVPFSQAVNIGNSHTSWVYAGSFNWGNPTIAWGGCTEARVASGRDITDDPPSVEKFTKYYWGDDSNNDWLKSNGHNKDGIGSTKGPNKYCPQEVTRMTNVKATITTAINSMEAVGYTHINLGAVWAWRMLSPRWRGLWGGTMDANSLPLDYNTELMDKAAIIMTDGENTMSNSGDGAYGYLNDGLLGTTNSSTAESRLDSRLSSVCTSMKNNNIIIYTITFGSVSSGVRTLMKNCATQADYYFNAPSSATLQSAFQAIGDSLANLRVSK